MFAIERAGSTGDVNLGRVVSQSDLILHRSHWKRNGKRVVFVGGTFDLLHPGHVRLLEQARELGDVLVVGVASDAAVREAQAAAGGRANNSGERPITPVAERMEILAALAAVDYAVEYDEPAPSKLVALIDPELIVEGAAGGRSVKLRQRHLAQLGRKVQAIPLEPGYSTTEIIKRIKQLHA
jgi:rfaE bifunctional protein nucleotidyltransferase chain/domain